MASNVLLFGWNRSLPGREKLSAEHFADITQYLGGLQCPFPDEGVHDRTTLISAVRFCLEPRIRHPHPRLQSRKLEYFTFAPGDGQL